MKNPLTAASAVILAASLAACDAQAPADQVAKRDPATQPAAAAPKPAEDVHSSVTPSTAPAASSVADTDLSKRVRRALTSDPGMQIGGVEVAAANGVVTLYGTVDAPTEKDRAAILALQTDGVRSVVNNLVVIRGS